MFQTAFSGIGSPFKGRIFPPLLEVPLWGQEDNRTQRRKNLCAIGRLSGAAKRHGKQRESEWTLGWRTHGFSSSIRITKPTCARYVAILERKNSDATRRMGRPCSIVG